MLCQADGCRGGSGLLFLPPAPAMTTTTSTRFTRAILLGTSFMYSIPNALASAGDRSREFQTCVRRCLMSGCKPALLSISLRLTRWTCKEDCEYFCMHDITDRALESGNRMLQYHGKWPFWRFMGMQEPASVLFSLCNLINHIDGAAAVSEEIPPSHPMRPYYLAWAFISMNTWVWSTVFHTRDTPLTEKLDYFSAAATVLFSLYFTVIRIFHMYPTVPLTRLTSSRSSGNPFILKVWTVFCCIVIIGHISYLSLLPSFDYSYNIVFNVVIWLTHNTLWAWYALPTATLRRFPGQPKSYRPPKIVRRAAILVICSTVAPCLELFDFEPLGRILDAHALWHLSTVLIVPFWYQFLVADSCDPSWRDQKV